MSRFARTRTALVAALALAAAGWAALRAASAEPPAAWSDPATWGGAPPAAGGNVTIPAGKTVLLDVDPPALASLVVEGRLVVADRDVRIRAGEIVVHGVLAVGTAYEPFAHRAEIVLDAAAPGEGVLSAGGGGRIELRGEPRVSWTRLASTAPAGSRDLTLATSTGWRAGDRLALAPTGFDAREAEEVVVERAEGERVTLTAPLRFAHWGEVSDGVDERAEVGLLTHNVVVRSEPGTRARGAGGRLVVMRGGTLHASGAEFAGLGRRGKLGGYPIHFHLAGDGSGSFVTGSSIHHSLNRCVTIHGTNGVRVQSDVAFDTIGHCYFLEDGGETGNVLDGNLGLRTRGAAPSEAILASDVRPATFWIANPDNTVTGNAAAGSDGTGFWYNLSPHPTGPSTTADLWPRRTSLRAFSGNVTHANEMNGLFVDVLRNPPGVVEAPNYSPALSADFRDLTAYKNRRRGVWLRGTNLRLTNAHVADNSIGVTFAGSNAVLRDSLVVGETGNRTGPPKPDDPSFPIRGFEFYDGRVGVERTRFVNFTPDAVREASALSALQYSPFFTDPGNYAKGVTFENAQPVYLKPLLHATTDAMGADGYRSNVFRDLDGSVTGRAGTSVVIATPLLTGPDCVVHAGWNAAVCDAAYGSLFVNDLDGEPQRAGPVRVSLAADERTAIVLRGNPRDGVNTSFQANLRAGERYDVRFGGAFPQHVRISLHHLPGGQGITVVLPQAPASAFLYAGRATTAQLPAQREDGALVVQLVSKADGDGSTVIDVCARAECRSL